MSTEQNLHKFSASGTVSMTPVLDRSMFAKEITVEDGENDSKVLKGIRIFKMGTFKNSMGIENTWEDIHLEQMVQHFTLLRDGDFFPNVPVRVDHSWSVKDVVGYFKDIYRDSDDDQFLSADLEITEPDAYEKWKRGTYRSRSLEVGMYETNSGMTFFPVVFGLAFVDVPAVEGLHARSNNNATVFFTDDKELIPMGDENKSKAPEGSNSTSGITDQHAQSDPPTPPTPPAPPAPQPAPAPQPTPPSATAHAFRVGGRETNDFAAVQAHIDALEGTIKESTEQNRKEFIETLAHSNKIAASQIEGLQNLVVTMTTDQFATFRDTYKDVPAVPGFAQHGMQTEGKPLNPTVPSGSENNPSEYETTKEIVQRLRDSGMMDEQVQQTNAYKKLMAFESANK